MMKASVEEKMVARRNVRCRAAMSRGADAAGASFSTGSSKDATSVSPDGSSFLSSRYAVSPAPWTSMTPSFGSSESLRAIARVAFQS